MSAIVAAEAITFAVFDLVRGEDEVRRLERGHDLRRRRPRDRVVLDWEPGHRPVQGGLNCQEGFSFEFACLPVFVSRTRSAIQAECASPFGSTTSPS